MVYQLYYWPEIQGRGEFVRLALEEAGADYEDVARLPGGMDTMMTMLGDKTAPRRPFAPPFLKDGRHLVAQTANILLYLGPKLRLTADGEDGRFFIHQLQLTIADLVVEAHDTHHPIGSGLYYDDQKPEALRRAEDFRRNRLGKFLDYFEHVLAANADGQHWLVGGRITYADLSLFQVVEGLRYAFPKAMAAHAKAWRRIMALRERVAERPNIAAYLASGKRIPFNEDGIFRHYAELDGA